MDDAPDIRPLLAHLVPWTLVTFRIAGVFVMAPLLTSLMIPARYKALLAVLLGCAVYPVLADRIHAPPEVDVIGLVPLLFAEALIGLVIGAIAALPLLSLEMAGILMGQNMGFGLARIYNPEADFDTDILGQLLFYIAAAAFIAVGGLEHLLLAILDTFDRVPLGGFDASRVPLDAFVGTLTSGFELAFRVSLPVTGIVLLLVVVFGVVGKTMPQINIMSVGFTIKIVCGLLMFALAIYAVRDAVGDEIDGVLAGVRRWAVSLGGAA